MLNNQQIETNWPKIKSLVLNKWNRLSEYDVEDTHGKADQLSKLIQSKYGNQENFDKAYERICDSCDSTLSSNSRNTTRAAGAREQPKKPFQKQADGQTDFENRSPTSPSGEAGLHVSGTQESSEDSFYDDDIDESNSPTILSAVEARPEHTPPQDPTPSRDVPTAEYTKNLN